MAKYLVKEAEFVGLSKNPYAKQGRVSKYTKWRTIAKCDTLDEAIKVKHARLTGLFKRGVWYKGQRVDGRR